MKWVDRALTGLVPARSLNPLAWDDYQSYFNFAGNTYPFIGGGSLAGNREEIGGDFIGFAEGAYRRNGIVFACMAVRSRLFSEARFQFQRVLNGTPGDLFGTEALKPLEVPWRNATTSSLLARAIQDVDLAGNFYGWRPGRLQGVGRLGNQSGADNVFRLRPDWMTILLGSQMDAYEDQPAYAPDCQVVGYLYHPNGYGSSSDMMLLQPEEVAHFAPSPDPIAHFRGVSWITPILSDIMGDTAATQHKLKFLEQGATANTVVIAQPDIKKQEVFDVWQAKMKHGLEGLRNAYKTLYLAHGADAKVIGSDLKQIDFKAVQGAGETRIASASGMPAILVGLSEGLAASTYSNYAQARRAAADMTLRPLWRDFAGVLETIIDVPPAAKKEGAARLWYDDRHIPFLAEDVADTANVQKTNAETIHTHVTGGFTPDSAVSAVLADDNTLLAHSGMYSVQLNPAGSVGMGKGSLVGGSAVPVEAKSAEITSAVAIVYAKWREAVAAGDPVKAAAYRELLEELMYGDPGTVRPVAAVTDVTRTDKPGRALVALLTSRRHHA